MAERIQRKMTKGWRLPEGAVVVTRPTRWGNPWRVGSTSWTIAPGGWVNREPHPPLTAAKAVESFRNSIECDPDQIAYIREHLAGKDLACWCPPDQPCHADVLLEIANGCARCGTNHGGLPDGSLEAKSVCVARQVAKVSGLASGLADRLAGESDV